MVNPTPAQNSTEQAKPKLVAEETPPTPLRCFTGALISGAFTVALYAMMNSIILTFANKPLPSGNALATNIGAAVRTLVTGIVALGMITFGIATVGLLGLGIQLIIQQIRKPAE